MLFGNLAFMLSILLPADTGGKPPVLVDSLFNPKTQYISTVAKIDSAFKKEAGKICLTNLFTMADPGEPFKPHITQPSGGKLASTRLILAGSQGAYRFIAYEVEADIQNSVFIAFQAEKPISFFSFSSKPGTPEELKKVVDDFLFAPAGK